MTNNSYQNWGSASRETVQIRVSVEPKPGRMMGKELGKRSVQLGKQAENRARSSNLQLPEVGSQEPEAKSQQDQGGRCQHLGWERRNSSWADPPQAAARDTHGSSKVRMKAPRLAEASS